MTNLRNEAQGEDCEIRIPEICNANPETTVLCHLRMVDISGAGYKAADLLGAHVITARKWTCSS